jgi:predicted TPR repeat methyltransferase
MLVETAHKIQDSCLEEMRKGGMSPNQRMDCFAKFETSYPDVELVKEFYDVWAKNYDTDMVVADYHNTADVANELEKALPHSKKVRILDIGAGTGLSGIKIYEKGYTNIDAHDGSPGMLELAKKLGVYRQVLPAEVLVKGQTMRTVKAETYDVIVSAGCFYPFHLQGYHLKCFLDCVKTNGLLVVSSCPNNDVNVGLKPVIVELANAGVIEVMKENYLKEWFREDDGTIYVLKKLKRLYPEEK